EAIFQDLLLGLSQFTPPEMLPIRETWMSADSQAVARGQANGLHGCRRIAGMKSTRHIGRRDQRHQLLIQVAPFSQVAVQIDFHKRDYKVKLRATQVSSLDRR